MKAPRLHLSLALAFTAALMLVFVPPPRAAADIGPQTGSGVGGTGAAGQVAVWSSSKRLTGYTGLTSDSSGNLSANNVTVPIGNNLTIGSQSISNNGSFWTVAESWRCTNDLQSNAASGNNALSVLQNGARVDFGAGATDDASSDGTTVTFRSPLAWSLSTDKVDIGNGSNVATATSVPSCNGLGQAVQYDATGHAFSCLSAGNYVSAYSGPCQSGSSSSSTCATNDLAWPGGYISTRTGQSSSGTATCTCLVTGSGTTFQLQLFDNGVATGATPSVSCTTAAGTDFTAAFGALSTTAGHHYTISKHTNCTTTQPSGCACIFNISP